MKKPAYNSTFAIGGVSCFPDTQIIYINVVLNLKERRDLLKERIGKYKREKIGNTRERILTKIIN